VETGKIRWLLILTIGAWHIVLCASWGNATDFTDESEWRRKRREAIRENFMPVNDRLISVAFRIDNEVFPVPEQYFSVNYFEGSPLSAVLTVPKGTP
jgi:hypothetical protein